MAYVYIALILAGTIFLPMWAGIIARLFVCKMKRHELAGLISLPFTTLMLVKGRYDIFVKEMATAPSLSPLAGAALSLMMLFFSILLWFVVCRGIASLGIRTVDAYRNRRNKNWVSCSS